MANPELESVAALGVKIEPAHVSLGATFWRITQVRPLVAEENGGASERRVCASMVDERGKPAWGTRLRISWPGGEGIIALPTDKDEAPEACFTLAPGRVFAVEPADAPGERASGLVDETIAGAAEGDASPAGVLITWQRAIKKIFAHYVLFGAAQDAHTQANVIIALSYLLSFKPAFGFRVEEAELAERVTIIGGAGSVSFDTQERLEAAGCWVYRIEGDSRAIDRILGDLQKSGRPFAV